MSLSKAFFSLPAWVDWAAGKRCPVTAALRGSEPVCLTHPSPGGSRGSQNDTWSTTQAWCFCLRDGAWKPIAPMLRARTNHTSAVLNGEIYVIGGKAAKNSCVLLGLGFVGALEQWGGYSVPPHCRDDSGCGGGGALRSLQQELVWNQPSPQVCEQFCGRQLLGQALPGGLLCCQVQCAHPPVLQPCPR